MARPVLARIPIATADSFDLLVLIDGLLRRCDIFLAVLGGMLAAPGHGCGDRLMVLWLWAPRRLSGVISSFQALYSVAPLGKQSKGRGNPEHVKSQNEKIPQEYRKKQIDE